MVMYSIDLESKELCLLDSGVKGLRDVPLRPHLHILNLHSNFIQHIENLDHLQQLRHLDLSSNQISRISGVGQLCQLRTLNLSCNLITAVEGLSGLRSLVKLNLSYNQIQDLRGFQEVQGPEYKLTQLELHGNHILSTTHVVQCLGSCSNLRQLMLCNEGSSNPLCNQAGYRSSVLAGLSQLHALDGKDRAGFKVPVAEVLADIPGLDEYMEYLLSSDNLDSNPGDLETPKIDQAMEQFRQRGTASEANTSASSYIEPTPSPQTSDAKDSKTDKKVDAAIINNDHMTRLAFLENQIEQLMSNSQPRQQPQESEKKSGAPQIKRQPKITKHVAKRDVDLTDDSDSDRADSRNREKTSIPTYRQAAVLAKGKRESRSSSTASGGQHSEDGARVSAVRATRSKSPGNLSSTRRKRSPEKRQLVNDDKQRREEIQSTYVDLMQELEVERERRWKAEQAARKLVDHIKELQIKAKQDNDVKDAAIQATAHLKQAIMNEKEAKQRLQQELLAAKENGESLSQLLTTTREGREASLQSARALEETSAQREREWMKQQAHDQKKFQDAQMKAAALGRELDLLRNSEASVRGQVHQLQELLASREQEHCKDLKSRYSLESNEIQTVIQRELDKEKKHHTQELKGQQDRIEQLSRQYSDLEDEFRYALHIESSRFKEVKEAFERCSSDNSENKLALRGAQKKEESSASMVAEMTSLVKEQKGRISELSKSKQEQIAEYRSRIQTLEAHVEEARKRMVQLELAKQEKSKLEAQVQAQSSLIEGMKAEKHLWGQELAQQGSSLAQDRGRLEAKIETLTIEVATLKKLLEREADNVKIKTKVVDDQTETIRKLKEGLLERDEDIKKTREDSVKVQKQLEDQIAEERSVGQDSQELIDRLQDRKEDLKQHLADVQVELEESQRAHGVLNNRWKEKSELIGQLEHQVRQMKESWDTKEAKLTKERDKAVEAASDSVKRIKSTDEAFRKQLDAKQRGHQQELQGIEQEREMELGQANHRILSVENEMRELLRESQANKKSMEEKVKRLTRAFSDIQADLS